MPSLAFNTHAAVKRLQDAGANERLTGAIVATARRFYNCWQASIRADMPKLLTTQSPLV